MTKNKILQAECFICVFYIFIYFPSLSHAIDNAECLQCHGVENFSRTEDVDLNSHNHAMQLFVDELEFNKSAHHNNGIACVDCHADIEKLNFDQEVPHNKTLSPVSCTNCHEEEGRAYMNSVHMQVRGKGITMKCYACHDYHYVTHQQASHLRARRDNMCMKCHNPSLSHDWLPQKNVHFDFVECTACHAPDVSHHIHLNFYDLVSQTYLDGNDILKTLKIAAADFMPLLDTNGDNRLDSDEFDNLVLMLRQKSIRPVFHAELVAELQPGVHSVSKEQAEKDCEKCHSQVSPFFNAVTIVLSKEDGTVDHYEVDRNVLEGYHTSNFYALAGTRVRLLDRVGIALIAGGAFTVLAHMIARVATVPLRRKKMIKAEDTKLGKQEIEYV